MKVAVSSYSFMQAISDGRMSMMDVLPKAKELGFDGVEIAGGMTREKDFKSMAVALAKQSSELHMPIVAYLVGADFLKNEVKAEAERLFEEVEIAKILGAKLMRHDATQGIWADGRPAKSMEEALPTLAEGCRIVTEYAKAQGIRTMVENHGYFAQDSFRMAQLITAVNSENFGWLLDMGNFLCVDEDPVTAAAIAAPHAIHAHIKDFHVKPYSPGAPGKGWFPSRAGNWLRGAIVGHGVVPVLQSLALLKRHGYSGWLSLEFEGIEDCMMATLDGLQNTRAALDALGM